MMFKNFIFLLIFVFFAAHFSFSLVTMSDIEKSIDENFDDIVDVMINDYSRIIGLYSASGELGGSASIGKFPSFSVGSTVGVIFQTDPLRFLKVINLYGVDWNSIEEKSKSAGFYPAINWLDTYFLPVPLFNYHFHIGLPHNLTIGGVFSYSDYGVLINAFYTSKNMRIDKFLTWGAGGNIRYAILRANEKRKNLPTLAIGFGVNYHNFSLKLNNVQLGKVDIDAANSLSTEMDFETRNDIISFISDVSLSKRFVFVEPFVSLKFINSAVQNYTALKLDFNLNDLFPLLKPSYNDEYKLSNQSGVDALGNKIGKTYYNADLVISTGIEFIIKIFRLGIEGHFSPIYQRGMISLGMRFQVEDWQFEKLNNKKNKKKDS